MELTLKENVDISSDLGELLDIHSMESGQKISTENQKEYFSFALYDGEELIGGLTARFSLGRFYIQLLAVSKIYRKQGIGKRLMQIAQKKAREMNCHHILLTTYSYQGTHFYPKIGFEELAKIPDFPVQGVDKLYFIKYLKENN